MINYIKNTLSKLFKRHTKRSEFPVMGKLEGIDLNVAIDLLQDAQYMVVAGYYGYICFAIDASMISNYNNRKLLQQWVQSSLYPYNTADSWSVTNKVASWQQAYDNDFMRDYRSRWINNMIAQIKLQENYTNK